MSQEIKSKERQQLEEEFISLVQREDVRSYTLSNFFAKKNPANILQFSTNIINQAHTASGFFAIHLVITNNNLTILNFLLFNKANVNIKTKNTTPTTALQLSINLRKINCAMTLIPHCDVNQLTAKEYSNLVLQLIKAGEFSSLQNLFQKTNDTLKKEALHDLKVNGEYCLLYARQLADRQLFTLLLQHGADPFYDYTSFFSTRKSVFMDAIADKNIADAAQMLLSQEKITDFRYVLDFLNICMKQPDQYHTIDKVLEKATSEAKQTALREWIINKEYCLLHAYKNDKALFDILLKHNASPFYNPSYDEDSPFVYAMSLPTPDTDAAYPMLLNTKKISQYQKIPCLLHELMKIKDKDKIQNVIMHLATAATDFFSLRDYINFHNPSLVMMAIDNNIPVFITSSVEHLNYQFRIYYHHIAQMIQSEQFNLAHMVLSKRKYEYEYMHYFWVEYQRELNLILDPIFEKDQYDLFFLFYNSPYWLKSVTTDTYLALATKFAPQILETIIINQPKLIEENIQDLLAIAREHNLTCHALLLKKLPQPEMQLADKATTKKIPLVVDDYTQIEKENLQPSSAESVSQTTLHNNNEQLPTTTASANTSKGTSQTEKNKQYLAKDSPTRASQHIYKDNPNEFYSPENEF